MNQNQINRLYDLIDIMEEEGKDKEVIKGLKKLMAQGEYLQALRMMNIVADTEEEEKKAREEESRGIYPKKLENHNLEELFVSLLLANPKLIMKYYILFEDCYFQDNDLLNVYKSVLYTEGAPNTPEIAKKGFNFSTDSIDTYDFKQNLKKAVQDKRFDMEKIHTELYKLFVIRRYYLAEPVKEIQDKIAEIIDYDLYDQMSVEEVRNAITQVSVTQKFKQAVLNTNVTSFLEKGESNLANGLKLPFPILSEVFKGIRKGETTAYAMPSNAGKSRFTINFATYVSIIHKKKVLVISNEMSEEKMKLCLITTVINNEEIQKIHGIKMQKNETELLEFKFRPDNPKDANLDEDGFILQEEKETREQYVERLSKISSEFRNVMAVTKWIEEQLSNSIYFINITDHTNDELQKVIMNYYYKEKIEYVFYDTLKTDTANIGNGEEIKRTATILSNISQNFGIYIFSTLQLTESTTMPINLSINDLAVSRTVKEVLDTLCLFKQIKLEELDEYEYS